MHEPQRLEPLHRHGDERTGRLQRCAQTWPVLRRPTPKLSGGWGNCHSSAAVPTTSAPPLSRPSAGRVREWRRGPQSWCPPPAPSTRTGGVPADGFPTTFIARQARLYGTPSGGVEALQSTPPMPRGAEGRAVPDVSGGSATADARRPGPGQQAASWRGPRGPRSALLGAPDSGPAPVPPGPLAAGTAQAVAGSWHAPPRSAFPRGQAYGASRRVRGDGFWWNWTPRTAPPASPLPPTRVLSGGRVSCNHARRRPMISRASVACGRVRQTTTTSEAARASRPPPADRSSHPQSSTGTARVASRGLSTPPCGVPVEGAGPLPASTTPPVSPWRMRGSTRRSLTRGGTRRSRCPGSRVAKNPGMSVSRTHQPPTRTAVTARTAGPASRFGRHP
jgi:hypothetical protein